MYCTKSESSQYWCLMCIHACINLVEKRNVTLSKMVDGYLGFHIWRSKIKTSRGSLILVLNAINSNLQLAIHLEIIICSHVLVTSSLIQKPLQIEGSYIDDITMLGLPTIYPRHENNLGKGQEPKGNKHVVLIERKKGCSILLPWQSPHGPWHFFYLEWVREHESHYCYVRSKTKVSHIINQELKIGSNEFTLRCKSKA